MDPARDATRVREFLSASDPSDYLLEDLEGWIQEGRLWAGIEDREWVALARLHDLGEGEGWVSGVRVAARRRGEGLGKALLTGILADARAVGLTTLRAVIEDPNVVSRGLFEGFGFRPAVELALRRGRARDGTVNPFHRAGVDERPDGPVGWLPERTGRVDVLPGSEGGRFGRWRPSLLARWASEGKLYLGPGVAVAAQMDWWMDPRTLWVNPLRGTVPTLLPAMNALARDLGHEEWQAFLPSTDALRTEYAALGALPYPAWGDRVWLCERADSPTR